MIIIIMIIIIKTIMIIIIIIIIIFPRDQEILVDVQRGIVSSHGERDAL